MKPSVSLKPLKVSIAFSLNVICSETIFYSTFEN